MIYIVGINIKYFSVSLPSIISGRAGRDSSVEMSVIAGQVTRLYGETAAFNQRTKVQLFSRPELL